MKKTKLLLSVLISSLLTTGIVLSATLPYASNGQTLTKTVWDNVISQVNENTTPPVLGAYLTSNLNITTEGLVTGWTSTVDNTNSFVNGVYTIPKNGNYKISLGGLYQANGNNANFGRFTLQINGVSSGYSHSSNYASVSYTSLSTLNRIYNLSVGDEIKIIGYTTNSSFFYGGLHSHFTIEYVGE